MVWKLALFYLSLNFIMIFGEFKRVFSDYQNAKKKAKSVNKLNIK